MDVPARRRVGTTPWSRQPAREPEGVSSQNLDSSLICWSLEVLSLLR
jgi:hypothetical protein